MVFLSGKTFMQQPPGYEDPNYPDHVCQLKKALYGLKQAPRVWNSRLSSKLQSLGFIQSKADASLYVLKKKDVMIYVLVYVDDIIVCSSTVGASDKLLEVLSLSFPVKDLGTLSYFLGIDATPQKDGLLLTQQKYIGDLLIKASMVSCNPASTPMTSTEKLSKEEGTPLSDKDSTQYRSLVGALQYVTLTRPDIAYAVNKVCQFLHSPTDVHLVAAKRILRYLKGTKSMGLMLRRSGSKLMSAYADISFNPDLLNLQVQEMIGGQLVVLQSSMVKILCLGAQRSNLQQPGLVLSQSTKL
jgi:hypothetical protein